MTVSSSTNRASYSGNGSLTTFAYGFKVFDQDDLTVILRASNGTETVQTITTHYTVTGVGDVGGGNVVFGTAPASGVTVVILREMDLEQGLDLVPNDPFPAQSLEDSLDKLTFMVQQHDEQLGRAIKASRTNVITGSEFVISAADRANKVFAFDSSGDVSITQEIGTFRGDWAASTAYVERDLVKDTTTNDVFIVNSAHTSSGSLPLTTNTNSAKYEKIIDISNPPGNLTVGGNISTSGSVTAGSFVIGSADINENDLESIDSITAGTVAASKAVVVDVNKDISSFRNLTASGDITFGGLSDGTITVTDILDEDDLTSNSATSLATQQSIKAYVDSQVGSFDTLAEVLANGSTTGGTNLSVSTGDDIKFADGSQAIFGAGDDLRINHTGSNSYISDLGTGPLFIGGNDEVSIMNGQLNEYKIKAETNGAVTLYYDNAVKMATTSLGIDVTGTITFDGGETTADLYFGDNDKAIFGAGSDLQIYSDGTTGQITGDVNITGTLTSDGLTVDGDANLSGTAVNFDLDETDTTDLNTRFRQSAGQLFLQTANDAKSVGYNRLNINHSTGDISFYEDTGTTAKFFWDASAESLGIGTGSPTRALHVNSGASNEVARFESTDTEVLIELVDTTGSAQIRSRNDLRFYTNGGSTRAMDIDSSGNVGIGTSSPTTALHVLSGTANSDVAIFSGSNAARGLKISTLQGGAGDEGVDFDAHASATGFHTFSINGTEAMRLDSSGNVGIGVSDPDATLDISGGSNKLGILRVTQRASGAAAYGLDVGLDPTLGDPVFSRIVNDTVTEVFRIQRSSGNVGIGTSSPNAPTAIVANTTTYEGLELVTPTGDGSGEFHIGVHDNGGTGGRNIVFKRGGSDGMDTESMRIDSSGNLLVGGITTLPSSSVNGFGVLPTGIIVSSVANDKVTVFNRNSSDGEISLFQKDGTTVGSIKTFNSTVQYGGAAAAIYLDTAAFLPANASGRTDNTIDLGSGSYRYDDVFATNGTIQTSDRNEKQDIAELSDAEQRVAVACKGLLRKFRWKDAVAEKGDDARIHFGIIAQDLQDAFAAEGLDAGDYAMFISSTWWEATETYTDDDGVEQTRVNTYETAEEAPEGATERTRLGVRYPELLAFIIAAI